MQVTELRHLVRRERGESNHARGGYIQMQMRFVQGGVWAWYSVGR